MVKNQKQKPTGDSASQLIKYINRVLDDIQQLKACQSRNPNVNKKIRIELDVAYHETKKCVEQILTERPEIKDAPTESDDPEKYMENTHRWCVGQLYWKNGERIGAEKTAEQNSVTTQDIEELLKLFRQLENLLNPALPTKDDSLWREAKKEAQEELSDQLRERSSTFSERPGLYVPPRKATKAEQKKVQEQIENRIAVIAEKKYCERDQAYSKAVDTAKRAVADVLKKIDHLLACTGGVLQRFRRTKDTWLVENFKEIRKLYDWMDKDNIKYSVRETIDVLEALKLKYERQERLDTQKEHKVHPCKKNAKATVIAILISLFIICTFELCVHLIPFPWLKNHPNSYGLQGGIILLAPCLVVGWFKPQWRKWFWGGAAFAIIVLILSLLGGPGKE